MRLGGCNVYGDGIMNCPFKLVDGKWTCPQCKWIYPLEPKEKPPHRNCPKAKSRGLGDTVAKLARMIGIRKPCSPCKKRQAKLNKLFPYKQER